MRRTLPITGSRSPRKLEAASGLPFRSAFTMIELLVVITILAILFSLSFAVLGTAGDKAKINSTKTTLAFLNDALKQRQVAFVKNITDQEAARKRESNWSSILQNAVNLSKFDNSISVDAAKALIKADRYRGLFPQRVGDLTGSAPIPSDLLGLNGAIDPPAPANPLDWDSPLLARLNTYVSGNGASMADFSATPETESAEVLYFLLTEGSDGISTDILNNVPTKHIGDTDGDGLNEFLDDWGHPLRFYNAPTSLFANTAVATALMPGFVTAGSTDPYDPAGAISATIDTNLGFSVSYHARGVNFTPLIVSCGPDELLGLYEPSAIGANRLAGVDEADMAMDNVTNIQRTGGQ